MKILQTVFAACLIIFSCACAGPIVTSRQDPAGTLRSFRQDILSSKTLSPDTLQILRMANFTQKQAIEEGFDLNQKENFEKFSSRIEQVYIESELAIGRAKFLEKSMPEKALGLYLLSAKLASLGMQMPECKGPYDLRCDSFKVFYAASISPLIKYVVEHKDKKNVKFETGIGFSFSLSIVNDSLLEDPNFYDSIIPSDTIGLEGLTNRHRRHGVGLALTGCRKRRSETIYEKYLPKVGACLPLTGLISFSNCDSTHCDASLQFHNALTHEEALLHSDKVPLAADFTSPFASIIEKTGMGGWDGLFNAFDGSEELLKNTGFYTVEPYDPEKIPLITVHGLFSNPLTWLQVHNDLMGDPILRKHFQLWHYLYPTNLPILINASTFRQKLSEIEQYMLPLSKYEKSPGHLVVISHSMGGILTRLSVIHDSEPIKKYMFDRPETLEKLDKKMKADVDSLLTFSRDKSIRRVIFVAVPHRGSDIADNWVGRIGRWLISLPKRALSPITTVKSTIQKLLKKDIAENLGNSDFTSINSLSKNNPTLRALDGVPVDPEVPFHSIIGDRGKGDTPNSSDGVVQYSSSHLEGAQSEIIVPADHTAHVNPLAIQEMRRILREHLVAEKIIK